MRLLRDMFVATWLGRLEPQTLTVRGQRFKPVDQISVATVYPQAANQLFALDMYSNATHNVEMLPHGNRHC